MVREWVVLLEAAGDGTGGVMTAGDVEALLDALDPGRYGGALHSPDRYALQLTTPSSSSAEALVDVHSRWASAVRRLGLPIWEIVRTEVFTPEELEGEFQRADHERVSTPRSGPEESDAEQDDISRQLLHQAFSDPLTGLPSAEAFSHRLDAALARTGGQRRVGVVCLDLDGFERINDRFGSATGDHILMAVAQILTATVRPGDTVARLGADEYAVLLEDTTQEAAMAVAGRILDAVRLPLRINRQHVTLSASAGIAVSDGPEGAQAVVRNAEAALGLAKRTGSGRQVLHASDDPHPGPTGQYFRTAALQDRLAHLLLTQEAAVAANAADDLHQAALVVMRQICAHAGCAIGHLWMATGAAPVELASTSVWHMSDGNAYQAFKEATQDLPVRPGCGLLGRVLATGDPVWISELATDPEFPRQEQATAAGLESAFAFPVLVGREVVAVVEFFSRTPMAPTDSFLGVLTGIGTQLGRVVERQRASDALRRSEEQLRASESRLQDAQRLARLGSWEFDLRTGESSWSDGMHALCGLAPAQPLDLDSALASVHPDDQSRARAALSRVVETGEPVTEEIRVVRPDGHVRWHRTEGSVITDENGSVVAIRGTSQDITESKLAEDSLRERERQLGEAQRVAGLGWWEHELSSDRMTWSQEMYRLWRRQPGEVSFDTFLATVHADDRQRLLEQAAVLGRTAVPFCLDFRATVADGEQRWFRGGVQVVRDDEGTPVKFFGTAQDVTEQKQAEADLRAAKELYQRIVDTAHEGIVTVDADNVVTFVNPRMAQILGYAIEEMTGMSAATLVDEETWGMLSGPGPGRRRRDGMSEHYQAQLRDKDGAVVDVLISASPLMDEHGRHGGALAMITDVTAVREAEEILRRQSERMEARLDGGNRDEKPPAS